MVLKIFLFLLTIQLFNISPALAIPDDEDDIVIEDDDVTENNKDNTEKAEKKKTTKSDDVELDSDSDDEDKDDLDIEADHADKVKQVDDGEHIVSTKDLDAKLQLKTRRTTYISLEAVLAARGGILDLTGSNGFGLDISPIFRVGKNFALAVNLQTGALFNTEGESLQTMGISLEPRIYFPIIKNKSDEDSYKGFTEMFVDIKGGYLTQSIMTDGQRYKLGGVNLGIGLGVDYFLSSIFKVTIQFTYYLPYWLDKCSDYAGQHHCSSASVDGHLWSFGGGIAIMF